MLEMAYLWRLPLRLDDRRLVSFLGRSRILPRSIRCGPRCKCLAVSGEEASPAATLDRSPRFPYVDAGNSVKAEHDRRRAKRSKR